jgi:lipid-binding SYLF domain-containing protein
VPSSGETTARSCRIRPITHMGQVVRECHGLAVLHVLRAGLHSPAASGSGVIVSRLPDGKWSGASAIVVNYDLPPGVDVADIVIVVNDQNGLDLISSQSGMLGKDLAIEHGPIPESDAYAAQQRTTPRKKSVTLYYVKSKGHLAEMDLRSMIIREANTENERFYGVPGVSAREILSGQTKTSSGASDHLYSTLSAIDQQRQSLSGLPKSGKCPGDCRVRAPTTANS